MAQDLHVAVVLTGEAAVRAGLTSITQEAKNAAAAAKSSASGMASGMSSALPSVRSVTDALGQQVAQLRAQAAAMKTPEHQAYAKAQQALRMEIEALTHSASGMASAVGSVSSATTSAQVPTKSLSGAWADLAGKWFLASQAIGLVGGAVSSLVEDSAKWQMMRNSISDTEGSASKAVTTIKELVEVAKLPGLDLQPLSKGYVGFRSLNVEGEKAIRTMKAFGNAIALAGGGANEFERVNRQLLQMLGKGRVLQEDISIIAESMPRIRELTKEAFGTYDIEKIRESGVTANEFVDAVVAAAEKLPQASDNIKNSLDNASTATSQFRDQLMPDQGIQFAVDGWTNEIEAFTALFKAIISPIETAKGVIEQFTTTMQLNAGKTGEWLLQQKRARDLYGIKYETGSATSSQAMSGASFAAYSAGQAKKAEDLTKKQGAALIEVSKSLAKTDLAVALEIEREKWKGRLSLFQQGSEEYNRILRAQAAEEARIRKQFAPKAGEKSAVAAGWAEGDKSFAGAYGMTYEAYRSTTGSSGVNDERDTGMLSKGQVKTRDDAAKAREDLAKKIEAINHRIESQEARTAKAWVAVEKAKTKVAEEEAKKRLEAQQPVFDAMSAGLEKQILLAEKGDFTLKGLAQTMKEAAMEAGARLVAQTATSVIQAAITGAAWKGPAMLASIASFGAADAAGVAGYEMAMGATVMRARGGQVMGSGFIGNEDAGSGREYFRENTPGRVYNSTQQTTNNVGGAVIHIHAGGGNAQAIAREVAKILPRASNLSSSNRSQTSRSGR